MYALQGYTCGEEEGEETRQGGEQQRTGLPLMQCNICMVMLLVTRALPSEHTFLGLLAKIKCSICSDQFNS